jgi:hypothetical protein
VVVATGVAATLEYRSRVRVPTATARRVPDTPSDTPRRASWEGADVVLTVRVSPSENPEL